MAYSKVILNDITLIDLTDDTVDASKLLSGYTATRNDGVEISGSIVTGVVTNNTTLPSGSSSSGTVNRGSYIKIGEGCYGTDLYYQAQTNSGTKSITASGTTSVDGYANASVPSASPSFSGASMSGIGIATSTLAELSSSINNSGVTINASGTVVKTKVVYDGAVNGWVTKENGATALDAGMPVTLTEAVYYVNGVTLTTPESGTKSFTITLPNGPDDMITLTFTVDSNGNSEITDNATVTVSGTTPTVVASQGTRYICGEVSTLSFTPSEQGVCDIVFTSGSTPTVLTVPNTVTFPSWFDPTSLESNRTYEINVLDGVYGAVSSWA